MWIKIFIIIVIVFGLLFGVLKIFKKPIIRAILNDEELLVLDAYQKTNFVLSHVDENMSLNGVYFDKEEHTIYLTGLDGEFKVFSTISLGKSDHKLILIDYFTQYYKTYNDTKSDVINLNLDLDYLMSHHIFGALINYFPAKDYDKKLGEIHDKINSQNNINLTKIKLCSYL